MSLHFIFSLCVYLSVQTSPLFESVWAAKQKYHGLGGSNNNPLSLTVLEAEKSEIKALADSVSGEDLLPGS